MSYVCTHCGETHEGLPDIAFDRPAYADNVPVEEREKRVQLTADLCIVDNEYYFIRGVVEIPIHESSESFGIGVWVSQKRENFETYREQFDTPTIGPFFGWFSNEFIYSGERTLNLKTMVHFRGHGMRPRIELEPTEHPLAVAQREGIPLDEAWAFVHGMRRDAAT